MQQGDIVQLVVGNSRKRLGVGLLLMVGLGLAVYAGLGFWDMYTTTHNPTPRITHEVVKHSTDTPDETEPDCHSYEVANNLPRRIIAKSVSIEGCIQRVGVDQDNAVAVPQNIFVAGWFVNSVKPGDKGISIIDGHVRGRYKPAIFSSLKDVKVGDVFSIEFGDRSVRNFEVVRTSLHSVKETSAEMVKPYEEGITHQLNLLTCDGAYNSETRQYNKRLLVVSRRID